MKEKDNQRSRLGALSGRILNNLKTPNVDDASKPTEPPKSQSAPAKLAGFAFQQRDLEGQLEQAQKEAGASKPIPIELIDPSPYQVKVLTQEQIQELAKGLAHNPLTTPVVVRRVGERFELIAGHRRLAAFKHLGRTEIPGVIREFEDIDASDAVFMDNMYAPDLADYEKYLGLVAYQKDHPESASLRNLAEKTGFSKSQIERLLSFSKLSAATLEFIEKNRRVITASVASSLSSLEGIADQAICDAFALVVAGDLKQTDLVKFLSQPTAKPLATKPPEFTVNRGSEFFLQRFFEPRKN